MYREIWLFMLLSGIILLLVSLILFTVWGIPNLIDELSGRKAKRQIKLMHELSAKNRGIDDLKSSEVVDTIVTGDILEVPQMALSEEVISSNDVVEEVQENVDNDEDIATSYVNIDNDEDIKTSYVDEEDVATTYIEDDEDIATTFVEDEKDIGTYFMGSKKKVSVIKVLEEQSSLKI